MKRVTNKKIAGLTYETTEARLVLSNGTKVILVVKYPTADDMNESVNPENLEITALYIDSGSKSYHHQANYIKHIKDETIEEWKRSPEVQQAVKNAKIEDNWTVEDEIRDSEWDSEAHGGGLGTIPFYR